MTTLEYNLQTLSAMLDKDPGNAETRLICADVLEEDGQVDLAATYRWMVEHGKWPQHQIYETKSFWWWYENYSNSRDMSYALSEDVYRKLPKDKDDDLPAQETCLVWLTRHEAESALCHALKAAGEI